MKVRVENNSMSAAVVQQLVRVTIGAAQGAVGQRGPAAVQSSAIGWPDAFRPAEHLGGFIHAGAAIYSTMASSVRCDVAPTLDAQFTLLVEGDAWASALIPAGQLTGSLSFGTTGAIADKQLLGVTAPVSTDVTLQGFYLTLESE